MVGRWSSVSVYLEIKSISITRLKLCMRLFLAPLPWAWNQKHLDYEIETLKHRLKQANPLKNLKSKASRLRDWNTEVADPVRCHLIQLEIKSISITRLKLHNRQFVGVDISAAWNQKHLDYEIETNHWKTRGRSYTSPLKSKASRLRDWNEDSTVLYLGTERKAWNQKHLDYEIETDLNPQVPQSPKVHLKSKASLLRDWNEYIRNCRSDDFCLLEIKSISITRLKHKLQKPPTPRWEGLEIKSISITRLKLISPAIFGSRHLFAWNQKHLDYEIETYGKWQSVCRVATETWNQKHLDYEIETWMRWKLLW